MKNIKDIMDEMAQTTEPCTPCPTVAPATFCGVVTVPAGFLIVYDVITGLPDIKVAFDTKCCTVLPLEECCEEVCGCWIKLQKYSVNACIDVKLAIKVIDPNANETYICSNDLVCFDGIGIACEVPDEACIFNSSLLELTDIAPACGKEIYTISGIIGLGCSDPDCLPTPTPTPQP